MESYSIYIHLPFCSSKCPYCDFHSLPMETPPYSAYGKALAAEWRSFPEHFRKENPISIYFGGGTPSIWPAEVLLEILSSLPSGPDTEITMEANPVSLTSAWLESLRKGGIDRVSIGVQALDNQRLRELGRGHGADDASMAVDIAHTLGFASVSADIIYGTANQTPKALEAELRMLIEKQIVHVSAYELTVSTHTPLYEKICNGSYALPDEAMLTKLFRTVGEVLGAVGIRRYEVSNYAREGFESRHNSHYWSGGEYVGLGSGAVGFTKADNGGFRYENSRNIDAYIQYWTEKDEKKRGPVASIRTIEKLSRMDLARERVMLGLRTKKGVKFEEVVKQLPTSEQLRWRHIADKAVDLGLTFYEGSRLVPTPRGMLLVDSIAEEFF